MAGPVPLNTNIHCWIVLASTTSSILSVLDQHREAISKGVRYRNRCTRCEATSGFTRHELRRRRVRVIVDLAVQVFAIVIIRWRCSRCRHVFSDLPDFPVAVPPLCQYQPDAFGL